MKPQTFKIIKMLTLTEPWASLMALAEKKIETRGWSTRYRGWIWIHAGKGPGDFNLGEIRQLCKSKPYAPLLERHKVTTDFDQMPTRGHIVGLARLAQVVQFGITRPLDLDKNPISDQEYALGKPGYGRYGWKFDHIYKLETPIPWTGGRGLVDIKPNAALIGANLIQTYKHEPPPPPSIVDDDLPF